MWVAGRVWCGCEGEWIADRKEGGVWVGERAGCGWEEGYVWESSRFCLMPESEGVVVSTVTVYSFPAVRVPDGMMNSFPDWMGWGVVVVGTECGSGGDGVWWWWG